MAPLPFFSQHLMGSARAGDTEHMGAQGTGPYQGPQNEKKNTYSPCMPMTYFLRAEKKFPGAKTPPEFLWGAHTKKKGHL